MKRFKLLISIAVFLALSVAGGLWLQGQNLRIQPQPSSQVTQLAAQALPVRKETPPVEAAISTPILPAPLTSPSMLTVNTSAVVAVTILITDPSLIPGSVNLLRIGATGTQPTILGVMHDDGLNGDAVAGDHIYTLQRTFDEPAASYVQLQVSAAFRTQLRRITSPLVQISVWGLLTDNNATFRATYPPGLYPNLNVGSQPGLYKLDSSPQSVDIGGGKPEDGSTPSTSGFSISVESDVFTGSSPFDINQWLALAYPGSDVASISNKTVDNQNAFEVIFQNEVGAGEPLVVVYHNGFVYQLSYASTYPLNSPSDAAGLQLFNEVLGNFTFTR